MDGDVDVDAVAVLASLGGLECSRAGQEPRPTRALLLCFYVPNALFLHMDSIFCSGRGSFLALSAAGLAGEAPVHYTRIWASVRSVARDLASSHGIAFRRARATQAHENPNVIYLYIYIHVFTSLFLKYHSSRQRLYRQQRYNSRASSFSLCDSHERCCCVCVRERACVSLSL